MCVYHHRPPEKKKWYIRSGHYTTKINGTIQRYQCTQCGRRFSSHTFSIDYYVKKRVSYRRIVEHLITTSSIRDMARVFSVRTSTIQNRIERLARNGLAVLTNLNTVHHLREALVADGFESFEVSQYFPNNIHLLAGKESQYIYGIDHVTIRRKGRMTEVQKRRRSELEKRFRADPTGIERSFFRLLIDAGVMVSTAAYSPITLYTDKKYEYGRALKKLPPCISIHQVKISSRKERTLHNPLFTVNYLDRQIRKDQANHLRETVCFSRNVTNALSRLIVYVLWHNCVKPYREHTRRRVQMTHAQVAGFSLSQVNQSLQGYFTHRAFFTHADVTGFFRALWLKSLITPLKQNNEYLPKYAYA